MAERVIYMRGFPPDQDISHLFAANPEVLADLKAVASLSDEHTKAVHQRLMRAKGFLSPARMLAEIREVIDDDSKAISVQSAIRNLTPKGVEPLLEALAKPGDDASTPLGKNTLEKLRHRLRLLVHSYDSLARFQKAERLATLTAEEVESIELICDLRPIFDESRKEVEGMMPYTRLRLVVTGVDGLPKAVEAELTHQQVQDLADKAAKATAKLDVLRRNVENWLPDGLPDLPLTRVPRKESTDA